jgi:hypothetical protein
MRAYQELHRTLEPSSSGVIVNGWDNPPLTRFLNIWIRFYDWLYALLRPQRKLLNSAPQSSRSVTQEAPRGTYVRKHNASWLQNDIGTLIPLKIWCWRSVSVRFMRTFIHQRYAGKTLLRLLYWFEERFPHFFGKYGQYPLIELGKKI